jgi:D-alanine-D-alanine ligase
LKVLVLGGGDSPEREVSLRSAKAVATAAREAGYEVTEDDPRKGFNILNGLETDTVVLPILHGAGGEDGAVQAELEQRHLAFLGSGSESSRNCFDKWITLQKLRNSGIAAPKGAVVNEDTYKENELAAKPHVLKVLRGGSSIGTLIARDVSRVDQKAIDELFSLDNEAVLEELVEGVEITVPILDMAALPALEVRPPEGGEFDYENKYNGQSAELCPPPSLTADQHVQAQRLAEKVHAVMGCRHLSRVDAIMRPDGSFVVLEINTIPGLTDQSLFPKAVAVAGMSMPQLVKRFVDMVERDYSN